MPFFGSSIGAQGPAGAQGARGIQGPAGAAGAGLSVAYKQLTNAQVKHLQATPITVIAAPGVGFGIAVFYGYAVLDSVAGAYTLADPGDSPPDIYYANDVGGATVIALPSFGGFTDAALEGALKAVTAGAIPDNTAVVIGVDSGQHGEFGGGNAANTYSLEIWYAIVKTAAFVS